MTFRGGQRRAPDRGGDRPPGRSQPLGCGQPLGYGRPPGRGRHHRGRRSAFAVAVALVAGLGPVACTSTAVSNQSVSVCYRAIPIGRDALHDRKAKLVGVHRVTADHVRSRLPPEARAELGTDNDTAVCAMTFKGTFAAGQVQGAPPGESGDYALVLVTAKSLHLLVAAVLQHPPHGYGGRTV